jgi:hypothetical protein
VRARKGGNGIKAVAMALVTLFASRTLFAQARVTLPTMTSVVVPVVGTVDGMNGYRWKTDVELHNDMPTEATVSLTLPTVPDQPAIITTVPPGESVSFTDVISQAFGIDTALSPLVVQTLGKRSIGIRAVVYGVRGTEVTTPQPIAIDYGGSFFPQRVLPGLSFSDDYRTNVGVSNLGDHEAPFTVALQRIPGRNLAVAHFALPPDTLWHASIQSMFPLITSGSDFQLVIETSSPTTYVYASVIENQTNVARFVQPSIGVLSIESVRADQ